MFYVELGPFWVIEVTEPWVKLLEELEGTPNISDQEYTEVKHIKSMVIYLRSNFLSIESGKAMRWIGYIQGVLASYGALNVSEERDRTRSIFNPKKELLTVDLRESENE